MTPPPLRKVALRLGLVALTLFLPTVLLLAYSYALCAGGLLVTATWTGLVRLWATVRASWREGTPSGRWRGCFWTVTMVALVSGAARLALRLAAQETDPSAPQWPDHLTGRLTGLVVVALLGALAILVFAGRRTGFTADFRAVVVTLLIAVPAYSLVAWDDLNRSRKRTIRVGSASVSPNIEYDAEVTFHPGGRLSAIERFEVSPGEDSHDPYTGRYVVERIELEWLRTQKATGVRVASQRTPPLLQPDREPSALALTVETPAQPPRLDVRRLGLLRRTVRFELTDPRLVFSRRNTRLFNKIGGGPSRAYLTWFAGTSDRVHLELSMPRHTYVQSSPPADLFEAGDRDRVSLRSTWPAAYHRPLTALRPHVDIVYLPPIPLPWIDAGLRALFREASRLPRVTALCALLLWPAYLAALVGLQRRIKQDIGRLLGLAHPPNRPPA